MPKKSAQSTLRNSLYEQQTRSGRKLTAGRLRLYEFMAPIIIQALRGVVGWCRDIRVIGDEHIGTALAQAPSFIPVYWHQHQLLCAHHLLGLHASGVRLGLLVSPSVDGEFGAIMVRRLGAEVIRGSSSHTGARALRDFYQALVQRNISPVIAADGPRGPPWRFKPGALLLAQLSQRPIIPMAYCASRAWKAGWDRFIIPKPAARIAIAIGEPIYVPKTLAGASLQGLQEEMERRLRGLFLAAQESLNR